MKGKNEIREAQVLSLTVSLSQMHLTSDGFVTAFLGFVAVTDTTEIVCQHEVPLNFEPQNKIIIFVNQ